MRILLLCLLVVSCGVKTISWPELRDAYQQTFDCLKANGFTNADIDSFPRPFIAKPVDKIVVDGKTYRGYYTADRVQLTKRSDMNTIAHEFVHHFVFHLTDKGTDAQHEMTDWYLRCGGGLKAE